MSSNVGLAWGAGERLLVAARDGPSLAISPWSPSPSVLRLIFQGHLQFMSNAPALDRSREYRASMLECLTELDPISSEAVHLRDACTVWSFIEAVYLVDPALDSSHVSARLADWYTQNFPELCEDAKDLLRHFKQPETVEAEENFWKIVARLAAVGSRGLALRLVSACIARSDSSEERAVTPGSAPRDVGHHVDASPHSSLSIGEAMLAECPAESDRSNAARGDPSWLEWQDTCEAWADEQGAEQENQLCLLLRVLSGNFSSISRVCDSWEEMLVASVTYARHIVSDARHEHSVVEVENACVEVSTVFEAPRKRAGGALVDAALGQPLEAIIRLGASMDSTWYAAHLCDLLMQAKQLPQEIAHTCISVPGDLSLLEYFILSFARKLEGIRGLWRVVADYYTQCPRKGGQYLASMLVTVCADGPVDATAEKIISFCVQKNVQNVIPTVCAQIGAACVHSRNLGGAMFWFARGNILDRVFGTLEAGLNDAEECGPDSMASRALAQIVDAAATAQASNAAMEKIAFARTYIQFQDAVAIINVVDDESAVSTASESLQSSVLRLICGGGLPQKYWTVVIYEVCQLLDSHAWLAAKVSTELIYELLSALEVAGDARRYPRFADGLYHRLLWKQGYGSEKHALPQAGHFRKPLDERFIASVVDPALTDMRQTLLHAVSRSISARLV